MYLKKITTLKNIGKFHKGGVTGGEYTKYTLFFAGNGRGKTTICAILRSFQLNDPLFINERQTLGESQEPEIQLLIDTGTARFAKKAWDRTCTDFHIFDAHFISENVHGGEQIGTDHRRNYYRIMVGAQGIALATKLDELDAQLTAINTDIATERKALQQHIPKGFDLEGFLSLKHDNDIDIKITTSEVTLKAAEQSVNIATRKNLDLISLPTLPENFDVLLSKTLEDVSAEAEKRVKAQIEQHEFHVNGEKWLAEGISHIRNEACPFCGQKIINNGLIEAYRDYFSEEYAAYKVQLTALV